MHRKLKAALAAGALLVTGGAGLGLVVGVPALNSAARLHHLEEAQTADDAERNAGEKVAPTGAEQPPVRNDGEEPEAATQGGGAQQGEQLQTAGRSEEDDGTAHIANWIAIESLRSAMAVYFISFLLGVVTILGLLVSMVTLRDGRRAARAAAIAAKSRVAIRITGSSGDEAEFEVFPAVDCPVWLHAVSNLDGASLRDPGIVGLVHLAPGEREKARGDVTSPMLGEGVAIEHSDVDGTPRRTVFKLRKVGGAWRIVERQE